MAICSLIGSFYTIYSIYKFTAQQTLATKLILYLHISLVFEEIGTIPFVYVHDNDLCIAMGFFRSFFGLSNTLCIMLLSNYYRIMFYHDDFEVIFARMKKWCEYLIFGFPFIIVIPFAFKDVYGPSQFNEAFCSMNGFLWNLVFFYGWIWLFLGVSILNTGYTVIYVWLRDQEMGKKLLKSIFIYDLVALACLLPRTIVRFHLGSHENVSSSYYAWSHLLLFVSGILFFFIFLTERKALNALEFHSNHTDDVDWTWDIDESNVSSLSSPINPEQSASSQIALSPLFVSN